MRGKWIAAFGVGATLALAACAQEHASPCPQLAEVIAAQEMYDTRSCARWASCHRDGSYVGVPQGCWPGSPDEALCDELASGTVVFHPERAAECAAALAACEAEPCFERIPSPAPLDLLPRRCALDACDQMIERLPGTPCTWSWSCPHGQSCVTSDDGCGGVCMLAGGIGAPCSDRLGCADHLRCHGGACTDACAAASDCRVIPGVDELATCEAGRCTFAPRPHVGEPCAARFECSFFEEYCNPSTHVCTSLVAGGGPCANGGSDVCAPFLTCDATGTCVARGSCTPFGGCYGDTPYCMPDERTCSADPTMQECDVPIVTGSGYETCPEGTACVETDLTRSPRGRCLPIAPLGASCDASVSCTPGSRCAAGTCRRVVPLGATCDPSVSCGEYQACIDGVCAESAPDGYRWIGASCTSDAQCITGRCDVGVCAWLAQGEPCDRTLSGPIDPCEFGCLDDGSGHSTCRAGVDHLGVGASCDDTHYCDDSLVCLPRVDGTTVCRPRCMS